MKEIIGTALRTLLVTPVDHSPRTDSCLSSNFYGTYDGNRVYMSSLACLEESVDLFNSGHLAEVPEVPGDLIWIGQRYVEESLKSETLLDEFGAFLRKITKDAPLYAEDASLNTPLHQIPFTRIAPAAEILYRTPNSALLAVQPPYSRQLDFILPSFFKPTLLPSEPLADIPVSDEAIARVLEIINSLEYDETIDEIVDSLSIEQMKSDITFLTGEAEDSPIKTRSSLSNDVLIAADWLQEQMEGTGATCIQNKYLFGFAPNVICEYVATTNTTETVLISAHYDSRGSFGSSRAPGANDDGSGTTAVLSIARVIGKKGITFHKNVQLVFFSGEEQGLYGSRAYSRDLRREEKNLTFAVQCDMLAYHVQSEPHQLAIPKNMDSPEVGQLVAKVSALYSPELVVGYTPSCCSDDQSFFEQGFPSTIVSERNGPIADPMYHNSRDLSDRPGFEFEQIKLIAKVEFAVILHAAGFDVNS